MTNVRLPRAVCAVVNEVLRGSHDSLNTLFETAGAPGPPPPLSHAGKWNEWLYRAGLDSNVDSLTVLGNVLEEFMDIGPKPDAVEFDAWQSERARVIQVLEENGFRYYRGGRVLPIGQVPMEVEPIAWTPTSSGPVKPTQITDLLTTLLKGLRRAMHPLTHRRKGAQTLSFSTEYDVQDLLHALLRPRVQDIRPEEFTPSYAGTNTRMDFLLPKHKLDIELKFVRDSGHAKKIGSELIVDIAHYRTHKDCERLWCVVYDPEHLLTNAEGLKNDLEGPTSTKDGKVEVKVLVL